MLLKKSTSVLVILIFLSSCTYTFPFSATLTPTPTLTLTPSPTPTNTPTLTVTPTASPTSTPILTATTLPVSDTVQSREHFEEMVQSGSIHCQGYKRVDGKFLENYVTAAMSAGIVVSDDYLLVSGLPSTEKPTLCLFIMFFENEYSYIVYKDPKSDEFIRLLMVE